MTPVASMALLLMYSHYKSEIHTTDISRQYADNTIYRNRIQQQWCNARNYHYSLAYDTERIKRGVNTRKQALMVSFHWWAYMKKKADVV